MVKHMDDDSEYLEAFDNEVEIKRQENELQEWMNTPPKSVSDRALREDRIKDLTKSIARLKTARIPGGATGRRGRKKGDGAYNDAPHLEKMRDLILMGKAKSPNDAANQVAGEAEGHSYESTVTRLGKKFRLSEPK